MIGIYHAAIHNSIINSIIQLNHNHATIYSSINRVRPPPPPLDPRKRGGHSNHRPVPPSGASWSLPRAASITRQYTAQSTGCSSLCLRCCLSLFVPVPNFLGWGRGSVATHLVFGCTRRHGAQALWVSCGLDRLSDGSGWRSYLYPFIPPAPAGSRLAAHTRPGSAGDSDIPERGVPVQPLHTRPGAAARLPLHLHPTCAVTFTPSSYLPKVC